MRVYDEATKAAMRGILPLQNGSYAEHTPKLFDVLPKEDRPIFRLIAFDDATRLELATNFESKSALFISTLKAGLKKSVVGWRNLPDLETGKEIDFTVEAIETFPDHLIVALYDFASEITGMTALEKEGLESLPPSTSAQSSNPASLADVPPT